MTHYPLVQLSVAAVLALAGVTVASIPAVIVFTLLGGVAIGCLMHSIADSMTVDPRGIALLWPLKRRGVHLLPRWARVWVGSESLSEWAFAAVWIAFVLSYVYVRFGTQLT